MTYVAVKPRRQPADHVALEGVVDRGRPQLFSHLSPAGAPIFRDIQEILDQQTDAWGIKVTTVEIKDIDLNETMVRAT